MIEPWWKQLKSLALKGRKFETQAELEAALWEALVYWNHYRYSYQWKKKDFYPSFRDPVCFFSS